MECCNPLFDASRSGSRALGSSFSDSREGRFVARFNRTVASDWVYCTNLQPSPAASRRVAAALNTVEAPNSQEDPSSKHGEMPPGDRGPA
jgi:hypothetical protein